MFEIETTKVPCLPPRRGRQAKYPFDKMAIGDSFVVPSSSTEDAYNKQKSVMGAANRKACLLGAKFTTRICDDLDGRRFVRCWRIS